MRQRFLLYRDPLAGDYAAAAGADAGAASGADAGADGGAAGATDDQTILGAAADTDPAIPEKFLVKGTDGAPDYKATVGKMSSSYSELEKRLGAVGMPPKTAAEYKLEQFLPEGMEAKPEAMAGILEKMHAAGLSQKQLQAVMNIYGEQLGGVLATEKATYEAGMSQLKEAWGDAFQQNLTFAKAAVSVYASADERQALLSNPKYANDPVLLRFLAKVGGDLDEDKIPNDSQGGSGDDIDALRKSESYLNKRHPDHAATVAKVNAAYQNGYKAKK